MLRDRPDWSKDRDNEIRHSRGTLRASTHTGNPQVADGRRDKYGRGLLSRSADVRFPACRARGRPRRRCHGGCAARISTRSTRWIPDKSNKPYGHARGPSPAVRRRGDSLRDQANHAATFFCGFISSTAPPSLVVCQPAMFLAGLPLHRLIQDGRPLRALLRRLQHSDPYTSSTCPASCRASKPGIWRHIQAWAAKLLFAFSRGLRARKVTVDHPQGLWRRLRR